MESSLRNLGYLIDIQKIVGIVLIIDGARFKVLSYQDKDEMTNTYILEIQNLETGKVTIQPMGKKVRYEVEYPKRRYSNDRHLNPGK